MSPHIPPFLAVVNNVEKVQWGEHGSQSQFGWRDKFSMEKKKKKDKMRGNFLFCFRLKKKKKSKESLTMEDILVIHPTVL